MTDTPMTPDQPTSVELTLQQIDTLAAAGNRVVNDEIHEELCACDAWPTGCVSHSDVSQGYWDMGRIETALPAVIDVWETLRNDRHKAKVAELRADNKALRAQVAELEAGRSRLVAVELLVEKASEKCNDTIDTDLLVDALGLEN